MNNIESLKKLITDDILIEVNENIEETNKSLNNNTNNMELKTQLNYMQDIKKYFLTLLSEIENNTLEENEAIDILKELEYMKTDNQEL